jgi:phage shock protein A
VIVTLASLISHRNQKTEAPPDSVELPAPSEPRSRLESLRETAAKAVAAIRNAKEEGAAVDAEIVNLEAEAQAALELGNRIGYDAVDGKLKDPRFRAKRARHVQAHHEAVLAKLLSDIAELEVEEHLAARIAGRDRVLAEAIAAEERAFELAPELVEALARRDVLIRALVDEFSEIGGARRVQALARIRPLNRVDLDYFIPAR